MTVTELRLELIDVGYTPIRGMKGCFTYNLAGGDIGKYNTSQDEPWAQVAFDNNSNDSGVCVYYHARKKGIQGTAAKAFSSKQLQEAMLEATRYKTRCDVSQDAA